MYFGVTITNDLRWNTHVSNMCTKANRTLGFLRRNVYACPQEVKETAYKWLVRPVLEYSGSVWDPSGVGLQNELKKVQNRAARFVTGNYNFETGSMTGILEHLKWESLKKRRRDRLILAAFRYPHRTRPNSGPDQILLVLKISTEPIRSWCLLNIHAKVWSAAAVDNSGSISVS